jgi:uncharacterized protein
MKNSVLFYALTFFCTCLVPLVSIAQEPEVTRFFHENGVVSSEGRLVDGKPDGFWKTYHPNGQLKSSGNRTNYELDSLWQFFDENGRLTLEINYKNGRKHGDRITYSTNEKIVEYFENDIKQKNTQYFDAENILFLSIPFLDGLEDGLARRFAADGRVIELMNYRKGFLVNRERINMFDANGLEHGVWKWFDDEGRLRKEVVFKHGLKNGFQKEYDTSGNLVNIEKWVDGLLQENVEELARLEVRRDYYTDGKIKVEATYRNGVPEGVRREFDDDGNITRTYVFRNGKVMAEGILSEDGQRQGQWKEYYPDGRIKSIGNYTNDKPTGEWVFYHPNGQIEQTGTFNSEGLITGHWLWYHSNGQLHRKEGFVSGVSEGLSEEYDFKGHLISRGEFLKGEKEGNWVYNYGDHREEGIYSSGLRSGNWKHFYPNGKLSYEGRFIEDNPHGLHIWYWPDGQKKEEGQYAMGRKNGDWKKYLEDGSLLLQIQYVNGVERKYDGIEIPESELIIAD